jgi:hypothetical protein
VISVLDHRIGSFPMTPAITLLLPGSPEPRRS